jgi:periplasmic protein TorT
MTPLTRFAAAAATAVLLTSFAAQAKDWFPYPVEQWEPPFDMKSPRKKIEYTPLPKAGKKWQICVSFPHMKDAYWLGVNYGVAQESKRLGVKMQLVEAGGYTELKKQISQIEDCVAAGAQAVVIGAISNDGLNNLVSEIRKKNIPVIDVINGISSKDLSAKSLVSFGEMGAKAGAVLAKAHPVGSKPATRASRVRSRTRPSKSSRPSTAIPAKKFSRSWSKIPCKHIRTSSTSPAPR